MKWPEEALKHLYGYALARFLKPNGMICQVAVVGKNILERQEDWAAAEQAYKRAIMLDPTKAAIYRRLSKCLYSLGRTEEAARAELKAAEEAKKHQVENLKFGYQG